MSYGVEYRPEAHEDLDELPRTVENRVQKAETERLSVAPTRYGRRLAQSLVGLWRIRVGDYRIAYTVDEATRLVTVWAIRHRKEIYPELERRWRR